MGRVVPKSIRGRIDFFAARGEDWVARAGEIGLTAAQAQQVADLAAQARQALDLQLALAQSTRAATVSLNSKITQLMRTGSAAMQTIRSYESVEKDPGVLAKATIPPRRKWSRIGPPPAPQRLSLRLASDGSVEVSWSGRFPPETFFSVERALAGGKFQVIGSSGTKRYVDTTLPAGMPSAAYRVAAHRQKFPGVFTQPVTIQFGKAVEEVSERLAA